jgi:hypothetical protein
MERDGKGCRNQGDLCVLRGRGERLEIAQKTVVSIQRYNFYM